MLVFHTMAHLQQFIHKRSVCFEPLGQGGQPRLDPPPSAKFRTLLLAPSIFGWEPWHRKFFAVMLQE